VGLFQSTITFPAPAGPITAAPHKLDVFYVTAKLQ
jgi:hypothetical protein